MSTMVPNDAASLWINARVRKEQMAPQPPRALKCDVIACASSSTVLPVSGCVFSQKRSQKRLVAGHTHGPWTSQDGRQDNLSRFTRGDEMCDVIKLDAFNSKHTNNTGEHRGVSEAQKVTPD